MATGIENNDKCITVKLGKLGTVELETGAVKTMK